MKLTRAAICDLVRQMPERAELDADVVVFVFVRQIDGKAYLPGAPFGAEWGEMITQVRGRALRVQEKERGNTHGDDGSSGTQ